MPSNDRRTEGGTSPLSPEDTPTSAVPVSGSGMGAPGAGDAPSPYVASDPDTEKTMATGDAPTISVTPSDPPPAVEVPSDPGKPLDPSGPAFGTGTLLASRYRIVRFIAKGGMGEVYEAEDLTLKGRVALKTILPEIARDPVSVERFRREIAIARRVTHPNVSRIYDIGTHGETMFLTMELLAGEDLRHRILRLGRLSENEARPIVDQIAAGLHAAHESGIIHRDFKSANVMLVPAVSGKGERAVVTDFGLARPRSKDEGLETLSESGAVVGTPAYMSPEQVEGLELGPATDIYALGIVLYEMLTGRRPFEGASAFSTAVKRLTEAPAPPRVHVSTISERFEAVILRCLARNPEDRFPDALDAARALHSDDSPPTIVLARAAASGAAPSSPPRARTVGLAVALIAAITLSVVAWQKWGPGGTGGTDAVSEEVASVAPVPLRKSVAILPPRNNSGGADSAWMATAIAEILATEIAADGSIRVASGEEVSRLASDVALGNSSETAEQLKAIRERLGVGSVVSGSYTIIGDAGSSLVRIDLKLLDSSSGETLAASGTSGAGAQLFDLVSRASAGLRQKLGLGSPTPEQIVAARAALPSNADAVRHYTEGLERLRMLDAPGAKNALLRAATTEPDHPLTHASLSAAHAALGETESAREEAARAVALGGKLGREQQLQIELRLHQASQDWPKAVEVATALSESFPDNVDYAVELANTQISAGLVNEALVTIRSIRKLPMPLSSDGRIDLAEARAYQEQGEYERQLALAQSAARRGSETGARLLTARSRMLETTALIKLGRIEEAAAKAEEARALFASSGDRGGMARAIELTADAVGQQGDVEGERRLFLQALEIHEALGDRLSIARVKLNLGRGLMHQGRALEAERYFDQALEAFRAANAKYPAAIALNDIGAMVFYRGDLALAEKRYKEALTLFTEIGEKPGTAISLTNIAEVLACKGELEQALALHQDSLAINRAVGDRVGAAYDLFRIGEAFALRGDLVAARTRLDEALGIQEEMGDRYGASETRVALARLAIDAGEFEKASALARDAEEVLRAEGAAEQSYMALAVLARALLAQRKNAEALDAANRAWEGGTTAEDRRIRYYTASTVARARAASSGEIGPSLKILSDAIAAAEREQFLVASFDARLAAGEIEVAAGSDEGETRLAELERDAATKGLLSISRRASALAAPGG